MVAFDENMNKGESQGGAELIPLLLLSWQLGKLALDIANFLGITLSKTTVALVLVLDAMGQNWHAIETGFSDMENARSRKFSMAKDIIA